MARKTHITLVDDVDGSEATTTVQFSLEGAGFEIDLSDENAERLRETLAPWISSSRRVGGRMKRGTKASGGTDAKVVRTWAREQGLEVPDRGRISTEVMEAYTKAH